MMTNGVEHYSSRHNKCVQQTHVEDGSEGSPYILQLCTLNTAEMQSPHRVDGTKQLANSM